MKFLAKQSPDLVLVSSKDGQRVLGHRSILCLHSPVFCQLVADQDDVEGMTTVLLPVTGEELEAVLRVCETGEEAAGEDWVLAEVTLVLLQVQTHSDCLDRDCSHSAPHLEEEQLVKTELIQRWKCRKCPETFLYTTGLEIHERKHDKDNTEMEDEFIIHKVKIVKDEVKSCEEKIKKFEFKSNTEQLKTKPTERRRKCRYCPKSFLYQSAMQKHEMRHDNEDNTKMEDEILTNKLNKERVKRPHFKCQLGCGKKVNKKVNRHKISVTEHNLEVHSIPFSCCSQTYDHIKSYKKHLNQSHHNYQCDICAATFYTKEPLDSHKKWQHEAIPQQCPQCPSVVKNVDSHIKQVHPKELFICTVCTFTTKYKKYLEDHFKTVHSDETKKTCNSCGKTLKKLKAHLRRTQCGTGKKIEANIKCTEGCYKKFTTQYGVKNHIKFVHLKFKNIQCLSCDYKTYSRFNLKVHVTKMHEGNKLGKKQCVYCDKATFSMDYHMKTYHDNVLENIDD